MSSHAPTSLETIVALCKRRGFVYPSAEIYGGINGMYDFGHLGTLLKENIRKAWLRSLESDRGDIVRLEGSLIGPEAMWKASGHVEGFHDPLVDCKKCKRRFRADDINLEKPCSNCGNKDWTEVRAFNMMFKTNLGALEDASATAYLRPETAQAMYVNFKNIMTTSRVKIPFGLAQMGKAFRNEITPKQFLFRMREFEQMEMQWFCQENNAPHELNAWVEQRLEFYKTIGINLHKLRKREQTPEERAHYSTRCFDIEYEFPFGWKELEGIAHRGNFDLTQHTNHSGKELAVFDESTKSSYIPHVVECSVGTDRLFLTLLFDAYHEDLIEGETRVVLKLAPSIAPIKIAFLPLSKQFYEQTEKIYKEFKNYGINVEIDTSGSIGKRYRRQDEIGTPFCVTFDFESEQDRAVTIRHRDTTKQKRISIDNLATYFKEKL